MHSKSPLGEQRKISRSARVRSLQLFFYPPKVQILYNSLVMKYFQSQEILTTTPPPGRKIFDDVWICPPRNYSTFFARHLHKFGKHCPKGTRWFFSCNISNPDLFISRADLFISGPDLVISGPEIYVGPRDISGAQTYLSQDLVIFGSQAIYTSEKMVLIFIPNLFFFQTRLHARASQRNTVPLLTIVLYF